MAHLMTGSSPVLPVDFFTIAVRVAPPPESVSLRSVTEYARLLPETLLPAELYYPELWFSVVVGISLGLNVFAFEQMLRIEKS